MLDETFIAKMENMAHAGAMVNILPIPGEAPNLVHLIGAGGKREVVTLTPGPRHITANSFEHLAALALGGDDWHFDPRLRDKNRIACFFDLASVVVVFDTTNGMETVRLPLAQTVEYGKLSAYANLASTDQLTLADFQELLLIEWRSMFNRDERLKLAKQVESIKITETGDFRAERSLKLAKQVESIKITETGDFRAERSTTRETLGNTTNRQIAGSSEPPPEVLTFKARRWLNPELSARFPVDCVLFPDMDTRAWVLNFIEESKIDFDAACIGLVRRQLEALGLGGDEPTVPLFEGSFEISRTK